MPLPTDFLLPTQWHLFNSNAGQVDLNVYAVWNPAEGRAYSGAGVMSFVMDDGFDYLHPDIAPHYRTDLDYDFAGADADPFGTSGTDWHGTAIMGLLGAAANNGGTVGVAFDTTLIGYRVGLAGSNAWLTNLTDGLLTATQADVITFGQPAPFVLESPMSARYDAARLTALDAAIASAVANGRGTLGTILVTGAGDGRDTFPVGVSNRTVDVNADALTNDTRQIVVGAVNQTGGVTLYSTQGAAILVSGIGSDGNLVTTDRFGPAGFGPGDTTSAFSGTGAAAAEVAGVVALMLEANPTLGWRDVQTILASSARHVGAEIGVGNNWIWNNASNWNGGGQHFSTDFGYGLVDARAAVRMAESWLQTGVVAARNLTQLSNSVDMLDTPTIIPDGNLTGTTFTGNVGFNDIVERVTLTLAFATTFLLDVRIYLTSPGGTTTLLFDNVDTNAANSGFNGTWTFETQAYRGERGGGNWQVRIVDDLAGDVLTVSDIVLTTYGASTLNDRYTYTDEYSDYAGVSNHVTSVLDGNGGIDIVDASAVTTGSVIMLNGAVSTIDSVATIFGNMDDAIGGDGNDSLVGSALDNYLIGNRGNDTLMGGTGNDTLSGGTGNDRLDGEAGNDTVYGGDGTDTLTGGDGNDRLDGEAGNDTVYGGDGADTLIGRDGDDFLFGGSTNADLRDVIFGDNGNDSIDGGAGNDELNGGLGNDTVIGSLGSDTVIGNDGNDLLGGSGGSDLMFGNAGNDTLNGGFGYDRLNGGTGADSFFHAGVADHGSDWIQDYNAAEGDVLTVGLAGVTAGQFQVNRAFTAGAGSAGVQEAFIIYRPTGQILWALVDGGDDAHINIQIGGAVFDLLA